MGWTWSLQSMLVAVFALSVAIIIAADLYRTQIRPQLPLAWQSWSAEMIAAEAGRSPLIVVPCGNWTSTTSCGTVLNHIETVAFRRAVYAVDARCVICDVTDRSQDITQLQQFARRERLPIPSVIVIGRDGKCVIVEDWYEEAGQVRLRDAILRSATSVRS